VTDTNYNVIYRGKVLEGFDFGTAKQNLMKMFSLSEEKAEKILKSRRVVLKKNVDESTAKKLGIALKKAGLDVALTKSQPKVVPREAPPVPPLEMAPRPKKERKEVPKPIEKAPTSRSITPTYVRGIGLPSQIPFEFHGTGTEYFKIWLVNVILTIITLGIYSPWAKVRRKQYLYSNTHLQGASFEYLADPMKILKGRAIVVGVLIVQSAAASLIPIIGTIMGLAMIVVFPWVLVRSLAFNARNSAIRNIRFGFDGTVGEAVKVFILWPILAGLTLGILAPYAYFRQKKFVVENSSYGTTKFTFNATAGDYYGLILGALIMIGIGVVAVFVASAFFPPAAFLFALALYLYAFAYYTINTTNLLYNSSRLTPHGLKATLEMREFIGILVTNSIAIALTLGLFHPWAKIRTLRYKVQNLTLMASGDLDGFIAKEQKEVSALGEEITDFLDFDFGL
jgi:uncharacterized membrane protein YjgN (DUF898 family)